MRRLADRVCVDEPARWTRAAGSRVATPHARRRSRSTFPISLAGPPAIPASRTSGRSPRQRAGPHVLLQALTHGNEVCGAIALDWLLAEGLRPHRAARCRSASPTSRPTEASIRADPFASRCVDEDFNRLWTAEVLDGPRQSADLARARELRPLYDRVDYLLDLHSMTDPLPAAGDGRPAAQGRRARAGARPAASTSSSTAAMRPASGCATTRSSTMPTIRATRC